MTYGLLSDSSDATPLISLIGVSLIDVNARALRGDLIATVSVSGIDTDHQPSGAAVTSYGPIAIGAYGNGVPSLAGVPVVSAAGKNTKP